MRCYGLRMDTASLPNSVATDTLPTTTPDRIAAAITKRERTKKWTAQKAGIPESTFLRKLAGHTDFTIGELARVASALSVPPASLLPSEFILEDAEQIAEPIAA